MSQLRPTKLDPNLLKDVEVCKAFEAQLAGGISSYGLERLNGGDPHDVFHVITSIMLQAQTDHFTAEPLAAAPPKPRTSNDTAATAALIPALRTSSRLDRQHLRVHFLHTWVVLVFRAWHCTHVASKTRGGDPAHIAEDHWLECTHNWPGSWDAMLRGCASLHALRIHRAKVAKLIQADLNLWLVYSVEEADMAAELHDWAALFQIA